MALIASILSKFDDSGIKKAKKSFGGLKATLGAIGVGFGLKAITDGLMDAAKAASADQKSMQLLNNQLKRNANATDAQIKANDKFIDTLSNQVGIVDDELRPAMGKLVRATGDTKKSQELLRLALDASSASGKPLNTVTDALSKAFVGNKTQLIRLFPALKESKDLFGDLQKQVGGTAAQQADPFSKFNVAMDNLKEKLGAVILPYLVQFIDTMMKPGGAIDQVGKFLDDVSNPKTDAGKTFLEIKGAVDSTIQGVKDFFALFGGGDAMEGFKNVASTLVSALPALLALKGILVLAKAGTSIANLAKAVGLIQAGNAVGGGGNTVVGGAGKGGAMKKLIGLPVIGTAAAVLSIPGSTSQSSMTPAEIAADYQRRKSAPAPKRAPNFFDQFKTGQPVTNNITINVPNADPKQVVNEVKRFGKQNGGLNSVLGNY
ncbi:MAG: hypothetical protein EBR82_46275 [Caulobacteraceae bacterium]|nr:hypothetical protein [Caulobacteraceae bacterium]